MKITIAVLAVVAFGVAVARPADVIPILTESKTQDDAGQFSLSYSTGNGIAVSQRGVLKPNGDRSDNIFVQDGAFSFIAPDGLKYTTMYIGDENGFRAVGDHLPRDSNTPL